VARNSMLLDENYWLNALEGVRYQAWKGYAFDQVCLGHVAQLNLAPGIHGSHTRGKTMIKIQRMIDFGHIDPVEKGLLLQYNVNCCAVPTGRP
jgi:hypothetical protein